MDLLEIFKKNGAVLKGHFLLSSGLHSDTYIQCAKITENPAVAEKLCKILAEVWKNKKIDVVIGPAYGGIILSYIMAKYLRAKAMFAERVEGSLTLRRGFNLEKGQKVLIMEDVVTTGGSAGELIELVKSKMCKVVGVTSLINRSKKNPFNIPLKALVKISPPVYAPENCPLCKKGVVLEKPGSRSIK